METVKVVLTLTEEMLGTAPANEDLYRDFIAGQNPEHADEEVEDLPLDEQIQRGTTVFARDADGKPHLWDYQIKGLFKDACGMLSRIPDTHSGKLKAYKKIVDGLIFVSPRKIALTLPEGEEIGICERPLRAQTQKGERVSLARSESCPIGTRIEFIVKLLKDDLLDALEEWLAYGENRGLGQWRNSGKGRFSYEIAVQ